MFEKVNLKTVVQQAFNLKVESQIPITESFASEVLHFVAEGREYVAKRPFTKAKAEKEAFWVGQHSDNPLTPSLLATHYTQNEGVLLFSALPGFPITDVSQVTVEQWMQIGQAVKTLHHVAADNFDGSKCWRSLLEENLNRYLKNLPESLKQQGQKAVDQLMNSSTWWPLESSPVAVHFDLRPGNILTSNGHVSGIIDFESMRGGHHSMDFYKLWFEGWRSIPKAKQPLLSAYGLSVSDQNELEALVRRYSLYHGMAGLAWCSQRNQLDSEFAQLNYRKMVGEFLKE